MAELHEELCLAEVVGIGVWSEGLGCKCLGGSLQLLQGEREVCKRYEKNY